MAPPPIPKGLCIGAASGFIGALCTQRDSAQPPIPLGIPKGLSNAAQGRDAGATLGHIPEKRPNAGRVAPPPLIQQSINPPIPAPPPLDRKHSCRLAPPLPRCPREQAAPHFMTSQEKAFADFAAFAASLKGDEKSEAQTFLFHLLAAFGHDPNTSPKAPPSSTAFGSILLCQPMGEGPGARLAGRAPNTPISSGPAAASSK